MIKTMMCVCCALVFGVLVSGCITDHLPFQEGDACEDERVIDRENAACHLPTPCCDVGPHGLEAICDEYYPSLPTPVMCSVVAIPKGHTCVPVTIETFECTWGESKLFCCDVN